MHNKGPLGLKGAESLLKGRYVDDGLAVTSLTFEN